MTAFIESTYASESSKDARAYIRSDDISIVYYVPVTRAKDAKVTYRVVVELRSGRKIDVSDFVSDSEALSEVNRIKKIVSGECEPLDTTVNAGCGCGGDCKSDNKRGRHRKSDA